MLSEDISWRPTVCSVLGRRCVPNPDGVFRGKGTRHNKPTKANTTLNFNAEGKNDAGHFICFCKKFLPRPAFGGAGGGEWWDLVGSDPEGGTQSPGQGVSSAGNFPRPRAAKGESCGHSAAELGPRAPGAANPTGAASPARRCLGHGAAGGAGRAGQGRARGRRPGPASGSARRAWTYRPPPRPLPDPASHVTRRRSRPGLFLRRPAVRGLGGVGARSAQWQGERARPAPSAGRGE